MQIYGRKNKVYNFLSYNMSFPKRNPIKNVCNVCNNHEVPRNTFTIHNRQLSVYNPVGIMQHLFFSTCLVYRQHSPDSTLQEKSLCKYCANRKY